MPISYSLLIMETNNEEKLKPEEPASSENSPKEPVMNRKEAIKKMVYIALSASTMMLLLNKPDKAVASSPAAPNPW